MRRITCPSVEVLEGKSLLSTVPGYGLSVSLTATPETTSTGTQVVFNLTETNVTSHEVTVVEGPSNNGFIVSQNRTPVWQSNAGVQPQYLKVDMLQPGQSLTLQSTWNGQANLLPGDPSVTGTFTVVNELDKVIPATFSIPQASSSNSIANAAFIAVFEPVTHKTH